MAVRFVWSLLCCSTNLSGIQDAPSSRTVHASDVDHGCGLRCRLCLAAWLCHFRSVLVVVDNAAPIAHAAESQTQHHLHSKGSPVCSLIYILHASLEVDLKGLGLLGNGRGSRSKACSCCHLLSVYCTCTTPAARMTGGIALTASQAPLAMKAATMPKSTNLPKVLHSCRPT